MTNYIVLEQMNADHEQPDGSSQITAWTEVGEYEAHGADHAIRQHVATDAEATGKTFVATPSRWWKGLTVETESKPVTRLRPSEGQTSIPEAEPLASAEPEPVEPEVAPVH